MKTYRLTDDELVVLDGKCGEELQQEVDKAKKRIAARSEFPELLNEESAFIASLVAEANQYGRLIFSRESIRTCKICGKNGGCAVRTRNGRHHRKGDKNYDKPLYLAGLEFAYRFVTMKGYPSLGCCVDCWNKIKPFAAKSLAEVKAVIPEAITGFPPRFTYQSNMRCLSCGWEGHEGQMIHEPTIMGNGTYPARCPKCNALNSLFSLQVKTTDGFTLEENK